jgi:hypothetical protein
MRSATRPHKQGTLWFALIQPQSYQHPRSDTAFESSFRTSGASSPGNHGDTDELMIERMRRIGSDKQIGLWLKPKDHRILLYKNGGGF